MFNQYLAIRPQHRQRNKIPNLKSGPTSTYKNKHNKENITHKYPHPVTYQSMTPMTTRGINSHQRLTSFNNNNKQQFM